MSTNKNCHTTWPPSPTSPRHWESLPPGLGIPVHHHSFRSHPLNLEHGDVDATSHSVCLAGEVGDILSLLPTLERLVALVEDVRKPGPPLVPLAEQDGSRVHRMSQLGRGVPSLMVLNPASTCAEQGRKMELRYDYSSKTYSSQT